MWNIICMLLLSYLVSSNTAESEFELTFYDIDITEISSEYVSNVEAYVNDDNSGFFLNFTLIKRFPDTARLLYKLLGSSMGEYIMPTGMNIDTGLCEVFEPNYRLIGDQIEQIGINGDNCPPSPGTYTAENIALSSENLPDVFPPNNYVAIIKLYNGFENFGVFKAFVRLAM
ncbi:uncharacterized protein [Chelonus insularis]|uniref:uncharacterized protein n=1 Tax=Chelonus insularis TaxID=460826 RepID=UPI00158C43B9|nr:uncharacterized protein LOC118069594 [Chelonus insularis]